MESSPQTLEIQGWLQRMRAGDPAAPDELLRHVGARLQRLIAETGVTPVLNQIELHPNFQQRELIEAHSVWGIATQAWSPLGQGKGLANPVIRAIAARLGGTPAQIIIRWHLDRGLIVIPKSVTPHRIAENLNVFDFTLDPADMAAIADLDSPDGRMGPDPVTASF